LNESINSTTEKPANNYYIINQIPLKTIKSESKKQLVLWQRFIILTCILLIFIFWILSYYNQLKIKNRQELKENYNRLILANQSINEHKEELKSSNENLLNALQLRSIAEKEALKCENQLKEVFKRLPIGICIIGSDNKIKYINPYLSKLTSKDSINCIGKSTEHVFTSLPPHNINTNNTEVYAIHSPTPIPLLANKLILDTEESNYSIAYFLQDISQLKEVEKSLHNALKKEKEISDVKSNLVTCVSHEFRTPMSIILSSTELLQNYYTKFSEQELEAELQIIISEINKMEEMIDKVLYISNVSETDKHEQYEVIDFISFTTGIVSSINKSYNTKANISVNSPHKKLITEINTEGLYIIISHLINNAIKYSSETENINININKNEDSIIFEISDQGIGIPESDQNHLFEMFHRSKNVNNTKGTGLGLAMVKKTIDKLGGQISFYSKENEGTCFKVEFPLYESNITS